MDYYTSEDPEKIKELDKIEKEEKMLKKEENRKARLA